MPTKRVLPINRDAAAGILFIAIGIFFGIYSICYQIGTLLRMGPGFFPFVLSILVVLLGLIILIRAIFVPRLHEISVGTVRPVLAISISILAFAAMVNYIGLFVSIITLVLLSRFAAKPFNAGRTLTLGVVLAIACSVLFVHLIGIPIRVFPYLGN
jgi:hypothetical protein